MNTNVNESSLLTDPISNDFNTDELKELPESFVGRGEVKGISFVQVKCSDRAYIYEVLERFCSKRHEVFARKEDARFAKIAYPKANSFGIWAWSAKTIEEANKYFDRLNEKVVIKNINNGN